MNAAAHAASTRSRAPRERLRVLAWVTHVVLIVDRLPAAALHALVASLVAAVGAIDVLTGLGEQGTLLYLLPVSIAAYHTSVRFGVAASIASAGVWMWAEKIGGTPHAATSTWIWSSANRLVLFLLVTALLVALRRAYEDEKALARADPLTGAANVRRFREVVVAELARARRYGHPVTLAALDVDDFKLVNDSMGHPAGDHLLCDVVTALRGATREVDLVARTGGDEFALLLPETGPEGALRVGAKLGDHVPRELKERGWPVSFSVGVVTCLDPRRDADELLRRADQLAYEVKRSGKGSVRFEVIGAAGARPHFRKATSARI